MLVSSSLLIQVVLSVTTDFCVNLMLLEELLTTGAHRGAQGI